MQPNNKGVYINVYTESKALRSDQRTDPIKRINPNPLSSQSRGGYDRRAQLLAYAQELRNIDNGQGQQQVIRVQWPFRNTRHKKKWKWPLALNKIKLFFSRFGEIKRRWKYETIVTEDYSDIEEACNRERVKRRTRKARSRTRVPRFCKKLKCFLKVISRAWKCRDGGP